MLPPPFVDEMSDGGKLCKFCKDGVTKLEYGDHKFTTKDELEREYQMFLNQVKEENEILKDAMKGDTSSIPEKLL